MSDASILRYRAPECPNPVSPPQPREAYRWRISRGSPPTCSSRAPSGCLRRRFPGAVGSGRRCSRPACLGAGCGVGAGARRSLSGRGLSRGRHRSCMTTGCGSLLVLSGEPVFGGLGGVHGGSVSKSSRRQDHVCELVGVNGLECGSCISSVQFGCLPPHLPVVSDRLGGAFDGGHWCFLSIRVGPSCRSGPPSFSPVVSHSITAWAWWRAMESLDSE